MIYHEFCESNREVVFNVGIFDLLSKKKKLSPSEKAFVAKQEKELAKALQAINTTDDLQKFFKNYRAAESTIRQIMQVAGENTKCIAGESPKDCMESLHRDYAGPLRSCIDLYVKKETVRVMELSRGRTKAADGVAAIVEEYSADMPSDCAKYAKALIDDMKKKIEQLEGK